MDSALIPGPCAVCGDGGPCQCSGESKKRPEVPHGEDVVWYRGWECGWSEQHDFWTGAGYIAYKGGCDLGAPEAQSGTWQGLLDAIDDEEDE